MLAWFCLVAVSNAVPTPATAILQTLGEPGRQLLAQSPDPSEEEALERDMERARGRLGHGDDNDADARSAESPTTQEGREERGADGEDEAPRKRTKRARRGGLPLGIEAPTIDGHGKAHYLGWGIADWSIAGGLWVVGMYAAVYAIAFFGVAEVDDTLTPDERSGFRGLGIAAGAGSLALGGLGAMLAVKAGNNLSTWRELRAQERALTTSRTDSLVR